MPYDVPVENVDKVLEAKAFYEKYYAKYPTNVPPAFITNEDLKGGK
ncbi:MAG: hypothetical protein Q7I94_04385 [Candidatus Contubernalis sp.]|nr:hypothetical protein [Candidatus Contubernalis sp.]